MRIPPRALVVIATTGFFRRRTSSAFVVGRFSAISAISAIGKNGRTSTTTTASLSTARSMSSRSSSVPSSLVSAGETLLRNPSLLPEEVVVVGDDKKNRGLDGSTTKKYFEVRNPASPDTVLAFVQVMGRTETNEAIARSHEALEKSWRDKTTASTRSALLKEWSRLIQENAEDIAVIMSLESGKPIQESRGEVGYGRSFLDYYAAEALRSTGAGGGSIIPTPFADPSDGVSPRGQVMAIQQAVGVTALITPWNFPIAMITRKAGPALAAGCTAVVKPSELTPLTALALETLAVEAGIPPDVFQVITADEASTPHVGEEMCANTLVSKISFTGSTTVGKLLLRQSSDTVKRVSMELGGNAPFVVFDDADMDVAVAAACASKFRHAGQTCVCADRFLVHESVHDVFVGELRRRVEETIRVGAGMDPDTTMGPLITSNAVRNVKDKVEEAVKDGATIVLEGPKKDDGRKGEDSLGPHFCHPTILMDVSTESRIWNTETFGPVVAVRKFSTDEEALMLSNDANVGLAAYFCTKDMSRVFRFSKGLECGLVGVNEGIISNCVAPFGGVKESGLGREGSSVGISEYLETKYVFINA